LIREHQGAASESVNRWTVKPPDVYKKLDILAVQALRTRELPQVKATHSLAVYTPASYIEESNLAHGWLILNKGKPAV
jgi:hypothetical protein